MEIEPERRLKKNALVRQAFAGTEVQLRLLQRRLMDPMPMTIADRDMLVRRCIEALEALNLLREHH